MKRNVIRLLLFRELTLMKSIATSFVLTIMFVAPVVCTGQEISKSSHGCVVTETIKPSVFLSYESPPEPNRKRAQTLLRLHNNTNCTIVIETSDLVTTPEADKLFKKITTRHPDGTIATTTYIPDPPEGALLPVYYDKQAKKHQRPKPANYWEGRDLVFEYTIPGGHSIRFPVNSKLFRQRFLISVPFSYEWEHPHELVTLGTIEHRVYYIHQLPAGYYVSK
jgi:hypothetical protein